MRDDPILVLGLGPAGAAAARLLAAWGHDVVVVDRGGGDAGRLAESIPPSAKKILRTIGVLDAVDAAGFLPWRGNTVWWGSSDPRVEAFPEGDAGYQVSRHAFDRVLREQALAAGARIVDGRALELIRDDAGATVRVEQTDGSAEIRARVVIDATGRSGLIARAGSRVLDASRRTIALAATWKSDRWPLDDGSHTLVASYPGGWAWSVPVIGGIRQFTVMVDPARTNLARGQASRDVYLAEIAKVAPFARVLAAARLINAPWGADASEYTAAQYSGPGFLLTGDAGSAINPLSSFGVKKALASGWLAAIAVHTGLENPTMAAEAFAFFDRRERAVAAAAARQSAAFAEEAAAGGDPFWTARVESGNVSADDFEPDASTLARDPAVISAFADLRARDRVNLAAGPDVRIEPRAAVRGRRIVMEDHLVSPAWPEGLRYLRGVDLVTLLRLAPAHHDVGDLFEATTRETPNLALPDFLGALSVLVSTGDLRHRSPV